jgi:hypothetical protein
MGAAHDVLGREEDLADGEAVPGERRGVPGDEQHLPDARGGLLGGQIARPVAQAEGGESGRDRPGRDQHDLRVLGAAAGGEGVDEGVDAVGVDPTGAAGERRGPDLDDHAPGLGHRAAR